MFYLKSFILVKNYDGGLSALKIPIIPDSAGPESSSPTVQTKT